MTKLVKQQLQFIFILAIGIFLIYLSVQKLSIALLWSTIQSGNFWIVIPIFIVSVLGYWMRSLRWKLFFSSAGISIKTAHLFSALSIGYAVNLATPRLGEVARCLLLNKTDNTPISQSAVTVILERMLDILTLMLLLICAVYIQSNHIIHFAQQFIFTPLSQKLQSIPWVFVGMVLLVCILVVGYGFMVLYKKYHVKNRAWAYKNYIKQLVTVGFKATFWFYTLGIWLCYFLMTYLWFFTFEQTANLGLKDAFLIMVVGSIGRSVPIQGGGMGAYHYLVSNVFALLGTTLILGNAMAFIIHGAQLILTFALGLVCWLYILALTRKTS